VPPSVAASAPPTAIVVVFIVVAQEGVRLGRKAYLVTAATAPNIASIRRGRSHRGRVA
jgi:hypothetical protein